MDSQAWDERYATADLIWGAEPNRWVVQECADLPPGRALDLAAGEGRNSLWLAARGWSVTAVDFSAVALDRARRLMASHRDDVPGRLELIQADVLDFRPERGAFDLVLIAYLHVPAERRAQVLRPAAEALAPGGTLLVVGHDSTNLTGGTGGPRDPRVLFTPMDVVDDLAGLGLRTVRAERVRRAVTTAGDTPAQAIDALVRLHRPAAA